MYVLLQLQALTTNTVFGPLSASGVLRTLYVSYMDSLTPQVLSLGKKTLHGADVAEGEAAAGRRHGALSRSKSVTGGSDMTRGNTTTIRMISRWAMEMQHTNGTRGVEREAAPGGVATQGGGQGARRQAK